jgi:4-hydroxybenzoate polyprenyltransferase
VKPARPTAGAKIADLIFLVRPPLLCASATFFFVGAIAALRQTTGSYQTSPMLEVLPNLAIFLLLTASAFVVNQILDVASDAVNRKNFLIPAGLVTRTEAAVVLGVMYAGLIALSALLVLRGGVRGGAQGGAQGVVLGSLVLAGALLGLAYSVPPLRLKARPVADLLANVGGFGWIGFLLGWLVFAGVGREAIVRSMPYAISMAGVFLNTCVADVEGDRAAGDRTSCVAFGTGPTSAAALVLVVLAVLVAFLVDEPLCAVAAAAAVPGLVGVVLKRTQGRSVLASGIAALAMLILVSICAPMLAVMSVVTFAASRIYYRRRLGVGYPRLGGADLNGADLNGASLGEGPNATEM